MKIKLKKGVATIIKGKQGCGKTTLAVETAERHGTFKSISFTEFVHPFSLGDALADEPDTLIVEEFVLNSRDLEKLKSIIVCDRVRINQKYKEPREVSTPNFIFCTGQKEPFNLKTASRRFKVVEI